MGRVAGMTDTAELKASGTPRPTVELRAFAPHVRLEAAGDGSGTDRTLKGTATVYDSPSTTQRIVVHQGSLTAREPLERVKLLRDHNTSDPVGYMTEWNAETAAASFFVPEGDNGDKALQEARNGLRDGLSIGFSVTDYAFDDQENFHVLGAELYEVSLVAVPDMAGATINAGTASNLEGSRMTSANLAAAVRAGTLEPEKAGHELAALADDPAGRGTGRVVPQVPAELATGPRAVPDQTSAPATATSRGYTLRDATKRVAAAINDLGAGGSYQVKLALADITQANDTGHGFIGRGDWIGELWTASAVDRPWINAWGAPGQLTSVKRGGFRWTETPTVDEYAGDKAEIPTSTADTEEEWSTAFRIAGGWDFDRIYLDLADADYLAAFWQKATEDYQRKSNAGIRTRTLAAARALTGTVTGGIVPLLKQVIRDGRAVEGGSINRIFLGDTLFTELEDLDTGPNAGVPLWLKDANITASITEATATVGGLTIAYDATLPATQLVAFDNRAAKVLEKAPFQVTAVDLAHGGVDLGLFSYLMFERHDGRLILKRTRPTAP